jgi:hypothetical protein
MRVVAFNTENGKQILAQDFDAVSVRGGQYTLPIQIPKYATTGDTVFQVCRTADPTAQPEPVVADGCREPVEKQQVLTLAECPQTLEIAKAGAVFSLLGARTATIGGGCSFEADTIEAFATDYSSIPSVFAFTFTRRSMASSLASMAVRRSWCSSRNAIAFVGSVFMAASPIDCVTQSAYLVNRHSADRLAW